MALLLTSMTIFMLQVGVSLAGFKFKFDMKYKRVGEDVLLNFDVGESSNQCSNTWSFKGPSDAYKTKQITIEENADQGSVGASRLSLSSNCSLLIRNLTAEDGGVYGCNKDTSVILGILSITSSPPDVNGWVDLTCSMKNMYYPGQCGPSTILWVDETGTPLSDKTPEFEVKQTYNCDLVLTVKHQSGNNKRFTCQFVVNSEVKTEAVYVLTE
ncbi:uncharacterized protein LOC111947064 isoform X2 [Oryzias latipes]|uniref:uncharacterized protein LOC111947064 isoform X1 n=1 Tax=Oryzias latipes TaxID=8090 RepID=UPI0002A4BD56|nr:uncharacterized protein LOC111947064 isoform X1 [Oryzias latipes]XP_023808698.1 uncharacterized protein LOC111947064 isoform X2 [Oryzias latipes]